MKKFLFLLALTGSLCACTTPEEDAQIKLFWMEQLMRIMPKQAQPAPFPPQPFPISPAGQNSEQFQQFPPQEQSPLPEEGTSQPSDDTQQVPQPPMASKPVTPKRTQTQFLEITMEDSRINKLKSNAPLKERQAMQRSIERVKQSNQQALHDIGIMFDNDTQVQAFVIISKAEKILLRAANTSSNYQNYLNAQHKILQEQDDKLNQLMRQNAYKLRHIRG